MKSTTVEVCLIRFPGRNAIIERGVCVRSTTSLLLVAMLMAARVGSLPAQATEGSDGAAVAGAALGLYSGAALGGMAAMIPCNQTISGIRCVRFGAGFGGGVGLAAGLTLGLRDADGVWDAYRRAGIGLAAGSLAVIGLKPFVDKWSWGDVAAGGVIGSSIAAGGSGAWIGLAAGAGAGALLWWLAPPVDLPDAVAVGLLGMAAGAYVSWIARAIEADDEGAPADLLGLSFRVGAP